VAEGRAGEVKLQSSSGYEILDNAAIQTVKTWKFAPARRFGQPVTQWFLVPIKFSLEDN
jgi:protein TonB